MTRRKQTDLAKLMNTRGVSADALAAVTRLSVEDIEAFQRGDAEPDAEAAYLIDRALDGSYRARLALDAFHRRQTRSLLGEGIEHAGIAPPPYGGGYEGDDATPVPTIPPLPAATRRELEDVRDGARYGGSK